MDSLNSLVTSSFGATRSVLHESLRPGASKLSFTLLEGPRGVLVASVVAGGVAHRMGLREGDVILSFQHGTRPEKRSPALLELSVLASGKLGRYAISVRRKSGERARIMGEMLTYGGNPNQLLFLDDRI